MNESKSDGYILFISIAMILMDGLGLWWGWNGFVNHVTDLPRVTLLDCIGLGLMKSIVVRGIKS